MMQHNKVAFASFFPATIMRCCFVMGNQVSPSSLQILWLQHKPRTKESQKLQLFSLKNVWKVVGENDQGQAEHIMAAIKIL
jgi:hypothetical protein